MHRRYKYFVFLNSGVRGPFLPAWAHTLRLHWVTIFTSKLRVRGGAVDRWDMPSQGRVKMVGPTINCGRAFDEAPLPHVQTYAFAVDRKVWHRMRRSHWHLLPVTGAVGLARSRRV